MVCTYSMEKCFTCIPSRKVKARPAFPALAVLPILNKDREARTKSPSEHLTIWRITYNTDFCKNILQCLKTLDSSYIHIRLMDSSPVDVRPDVLRCVIIHNTFDPVDVDASGSCVCTDQPSERHVRLINCSLKLTVQGFMND